MHICRPSITSYQIRSAHRYISKHTPIPTHTAHGPRGIPPIANPREVPLKAFFAPVPPPQNPTGTFAHRHVSAPRCCIFGGFACTNSFYRGFATLRAPQTVCRITSEAAAPSKNRQCVYWILDAVLVIGSRRRGTTSQLEFTVWNPQRSVEFRYSGRESRRACFSEGFPVPEGPIGSYLVTSLRDPSRNSPFLVILTYVSEKFRL